MSIQKPEPLVIGNKAFYTLTSYDPVDVEIVTLPSNDEEMNLVLAYMVKEAGGTMKDLDDPTWVQQHFNGAKNVEELREGVRKEMELVRQDDASRQKADRCLDELASRLCQSVPASEVDATAEDMALSFCEEIASGAPQQNLAIDELLSRMGMSFEQLKASMAEPARVEAERQAALEAYASEKKIKADETELPTLLHLSPADADVILKQARSNNQLDFIMDAATRVKALNALVAESHFSYRPETEEETKARLDAMRQQLAMVGTAAPSAASTPVDTDDKGPGQGTTGTPNLKFV